MAGDTETGICLMQMEAGLDTGPVFSSATTPITDTTTFGTLHDQLAQSGAELLARDLSAILNGQLRAIPQPAEGVTYAQKILNEEAAIQWDAPFLEVSRFVRGLNPVPGAFTTLLGKRLKVFQVERREGAPAAPGTVVTTTGELLIGCRDAQLALTSVQLEGKRRMDGSELLRGFPVPIGTKLGDTAAT
jgi:methionyl-tRNA formyltransferase